MRTTIVAIALIIAISAVSCIAQEQQLGATVRVGAAAGLMWIAGIESLSTVGGSIGYSSAPPYGIDLSYWHAGISLLGVSLLSVDAFNLSLVLDLTATERFNIYLTGGGGFVLAGAFGEGIGGFMATAGIGLRVSLIEMVSVFVEYRPMIKNGILHVIQGGISLTF